MPVEEVLFDFTVLSFGNPLITAAIIALIRGLAGWLENACEDGKITLPELKLLGATLFRVMVQALGLGALFPGAEVGALFTDWVVVKITNAIKKH